MCPGAVSSQSHPWCVLALPCAVQVVPKDKARIRVQLSAGHTTEQVNQAVDAFIAVGKQLGVIPGPARL